MDTLEVDRRKNALNPIDTDKRWYQGQFSRRDKTNSKALPSPDEVRKQSTQTGGPVKSIDLALRALREDRRLCDVIVTRFADGLPRHTQNEFPSDGRFRILVLTSTSSLDPQGISMPSPKELCTTIMPQFASGLLELVILHLLSPHSLE